MSFWALIGTIYGLGKVLLILGVLLELAMGPYERRRYPAPGRMVRVEGGRLHLLSGGEGPGSGEGPGAGGGGGPTVVLEGGIGCPGVLWSRVFKGLARTGRVCLYDRAGYGWSDRSRLPRTGAQIVTDLHQLLREAGMPGPYILVGHAAGGMYARLYAQTYPEQVAGLVLVEARHEDLSEAQGRWRRWLERLMPLAGLYFAVLGVMRLLLWLAPSLLTGRRDLIRPFPARWRRLVRMQLARPATYRASGAELRQLAGVEAALRAAPGLGDLPVTVLTGGRADPPPLKLGWLARQRALWLNGQHRLAALSSRTHHQVVEGAGHLLPLERPEAVIEAVLALRERVRRGN